METGTIIIGSGILVIIILIYIVRFLKIRAMNRKLNCRVESVRSPEELLASLPNWSIRNRKPSKFWNGKKEFIRVVLLSKIIGTKTFWAHWDGIGLIRTETRAYAVPKQNIYGDVYIYDIDKKQSVTEILQVGEADAEDSFHELQVANMYYSIGRIAGANELDKKIGMIFILSILTFLAVLGMAAFVYMRTKDISAAIQMIQNSLPTVAQTIVVK